MRGSLRGRVLEIADGTGGRGYEGDVEFQLTGDFSFDIARVVEVEHDCEDQACDIRAALAEGFPFSAAHLLSGATETPVLDAVLSAYEKSLVGPSGWPADWDGWCAYHKANGVRCATCEAFNYPVDGWMDETCGSCGKALPSGEA